MFKAEFWNAYAKIRQDGHNFIDVVVDTPEETIYVQLTSGDNHAKRVDKILNLESAQQLLSWGRVIECWSWAKRGPRGTRKKWVLRRQRL